MSRAAALPRRAPGNLRTIAVTPGAAADRAADPGLTLRAEIETRVPSRAPAFMTLMAGVLQVLLGDDP